MHQSCSCELLEVMCSCSARLRERERERREGGRERERERCHVLPVCTSFTSPGCNGMEVLSAAACTEIIWNKDSSSEFLLVTSACLWLRPCPDSPDLHFNIFIHNIFHFSILKTLLECVVVLKRKVSFSKLIYYSETALFLGSCFFICLVFILICEIVL